MTSGPSTIAPTINICDSGGLDIHRPGRVCHSDRHPSEHHDRNDVPCRRDAAGRTSGRQRALARLREFDVQPRSADFSFGPACFFRNLRRSGWTAQEEELGKNRVHRADELGHSLESGRPDSHVLLPGHVSRHAAGREIASFRGTIQYDAQRHVRVQSRLCRRLRRVVRMDYQKAGFNGNSKRVFCWLVRRQTRRFRFPPSPREKTRTRHPARRDHRLHGN